MIRSITLLQLRSRAFSSSKSSSISREARAQLRANRKAALKKGESNSTVSSASGSGSASSTTTSNTTKLLPRVLGGALLVSSSVLFWGIVSPSQDSIPSKLASTIGLTSIWNYFAEGFNKPHRDILLPNWPMPNVPQDLPCPHTLVLDLEGTLVNSSWTKRYGWRHAKRPGVDEFLRELSQYYEIVLFSPSMQGVAEPVVASLDKNGCIMHHLYREATRYINGKHVKDLSMLNRNVSRIVVIDDDALECQLHPGNLLKIKSYDDPTDREDRVLLDMIPLLIEIAKENYKDVPNLLAQFQRDDGTRMDGEEIAQEYQRRLQDLRDSQLDQKMRGIGRFNKVGGLNKDMSEQLEDFQRTNAMKSQGLTAKDIVGSEPPRDWDQDQKSKKKGRLTSWYEQRQQNQAEEKRIQQEKWQEVMMKMAEEKEKEKEKSKQQ